MSYLRKFKNELKKIETPEKKAVLGTYYVEEKKQNEKAIKAKKLTLTPLIAIILCVCMVLGVAATIPAIVKFVNAKILTNNNRRLDKVPDGYIGIYSAEDFDKIRDNPRANYILMRDIDLSGINFAPIESTDAGEIFSGIFNGNGYTVKNLTLDSSDSKNGYFGLFGKTKGCFINLTVEDFTLDIELYNSQNDVCIGTIAGSATFVGGCYANDCEINVVCNDLYENELYVGGLAGTADYVDSCAVYSNVSISGSGGNVYAALGTASTFSAATTYTVGKINTNGDFTSLLTNNVALTITDASMPVMLGETAMQTIIQKLEEYYDDNRFYINKFKSFFVPVEKSAGTQYDNLVEANQLFGYFHLSDEETVYVFDNRAKPDEVKMVYRELTAIFGSQDALLQFCNENNIKCGMISCYSFDSTDSFSEETLIGFDFENIWAQEYRIIPKIFID